jgi:hypothetical protein
MRRMTATSSAMTTGALAGAMTLIRLVLVPFWRRSASSEFKPWFREAAPRLRALMVPLGAAAAGTTTANALITRRGRAALGAAAAAGVAVVTMAVNEPLNARFEVRTRSSPRNSIDGCGGMTCVSRWVFSRRGRRWAP